ncbi:hypothetical protein [Ferrimonas sediminum]|uniref:hypothetical protein n=1 Tax=Ferrimonas sediminum TaxID=718193 RepID=UPI00115FE581|nr:hypothetical protein [Ferrimonas sediminum]
MALTTQTRLSHLYGLRQARRIPGYYLNALYRHYGHQLTREDRTTLTPLVSAPRWMPPCSKAGNP